MGSWFECLSPPVLSGNDNKNQGKQNQYIWSLLKKELHHCCKEYFGMPLE